MFLSDTAIKRPVTTILFTAGILIFGYIAFQNMGVDLSDIKNWAEIDRIEGANLAESENAPEGFLEWCKKNGALF